MLLRFAANDVNHCVWRDSRVILSNQQSVFTQLAKKKNLKKPGQTHQCCNTGLNVGVTAERSYLRPWSRVPFVCVDWSNRHAIVLQIWKSIIRCSGKRHFVPRSLSAWQPLPCGFGAKNKEPWVKDRFLALGPFFARPTLKIPFLVVPPSLFASKPHGSTCHIG